MHIHGPPECEDNERHHERGEDEALLEKEEAGHEDLEDEDAPDEASEGDRPRLALGFVGFVENYGNVR